MIDNIDIGNMEISIRKLLMVVNLVQMVREVSICTLLLEWIVIRILQVILLVVRFTTLGEGIHST